MKITEYINGSTIKSVGGKDVRTGMTNQRYQPTTKTALLPNSSGEWTKHIWWHTEQKKDTWVHYFRCQKTYELRVWGVDGPPEARDPR